MSFDPLTNPIDFVMLAGRRSPGVAELANANSPRRWDVRKGYALSGATTRFRGVDISHFALRLTFTSAQDWVDWHDWRDIVQRPPIGERARNLEIWHPITEDLGITTVGVEDVKQPVQVGPGEWMIEILLLEVRTPVFQLSAPEGSQDRPEDPADRTIEALTGIVQNGGEGDVLGALSHLGDL